MLIIDKQEVSLKPIKIGYDFFNERSERTGADTKKHLQNKAEQYFQKYKVEIDSTDVFCDSFTEYFNTQFEKIYSDKLPEFIPLQKKIEMTGVSISELKSIENAFKDISTPYDVMTKDIPTDRNYNIYATTKEQQTRLKACLQIIKGIKQLAKLGVNMYQQKQVEATRRCLQFKNGELVPNEYYVLNGQSVYH
jgi:S-methylmethionine-dependent homocysteine/selenocysteine methylase